MTGDFRPTEEQQHIIALNEGAYLVVAPPGSGKTQVLTQRVIRLLRESSGKRFRILALTYTTRAAENMVTRIESQVAEDWRRVTARTFHAFCLSVLQNYGDSLGVGPGFSVYENQDDRIETLARGLSDEGLLLDRGDDEVKSLRRLLAEISRLKRQLVPPDAVVEAVSNEIAPTKVAYAAYDRTLRLYNAVDFDDLLGLTYRLFTEQPRIAQHYRRLFRYILVDEGQDTSLAQYEVLRALCGDTHRNVMLVADGNQFIYRFAGASDRFLKAFVDDFGAVEVPLHLNFRCAETIVTAANALIAHNRKRTVTASAMKSEAQARGHVTASSYEDEASEGCGVVDFVQLLLTHGLDKEWLNPTEETAVVPQEICILSRNRFQLNAVLRELEHRAIPYAFATGELGLFDSGLFKVAYYALRVVGNPKDLLSRRNLMAVNGASVDVVDGILGGSVESFLSAAAKQNEGSCAAVLAFLAAAVSDVTSDDKLLQRFVEEARRLASLAEADELRALEEADLAVFVGRLRAHRRQSEESEVSIHGLLSELSLVRRAPQDSPGIRALTIHAAKGLEFNTVILVGMNDGSFPDFRSVGTEEALADERRNAYVAVTRAARRLHLTRPRSRTMPWGGVKAQSPSRFLAELQIVMDDQ